MSRLEFDEEMDFTFDDQDLNEDEESCIDELEETEEDEIEQDIYDRVWSNQNFSGELEDDSDSEYDSEDFELEVIAGEQAEFESDS